MFAQNRDAGGKLSYTSIKSASDKRAKLQRTLQSGDKDHIEFALPEGYRSLLRGLYYKDTTVFIVHCVY